jgi:hypothetical protein
MKYIILHIPTDTYCSPLAYGDREFCKDIADARQWEFKHHAQFTLESAVQAGKITLINEVLLNGLAIYYKRYHREVFSEDEFLIIEVESK